MPAQYNKTRSNVGQNFAFNDADHGDDPAPVASDFTGIGGGTPLSIGDARDITDWHQDGCAEIEDANPDQPVLAAPGDAILNGGLLFLGSRSSTAPDLAPNLAVDWTSGPTVIPPLIISVAGDEDPMGKAARNRSASNATGNLAILDGSGDLAEIFHAAFL